MSMFKDIANEQKETQAQKKAQLQQLENKIINQSLPAFNDAIFADMNNGAEQILKNQREIDSKCKAVREEWQKFNDELINWTKIVNQLDSAVKAIGDVRSWANTIQGEVQGIVDQIGNKTPAQ